MGKPVYQESAYLSDFELNGGEEMLQQDKKDELELVLMKLLSQEKSTTGADFRLLMQLGPEEKRAILMAEEATRQEKEATQARQRAELAAEVANIKDKETKDARQKAMLTEEELLGKEKEARDARQRAELAAEGAKIKNKEAKETRQRAILAEEELLGKEKQGTRENGNKFRTVPSSKIIAPDNCELLDGKFTLVFSPGAAYIKISDLIRSLSMEPNLQTMETGGIAGKGSWIKISIGSPLPLFRILNHIPSVRQVSWKRDAIHVDIR